MEERNDAFDSAIREKLSGHEPAVPHALWTRISAELNESEELAAPVAPQLQTSVAATPWWRVAAAAAVVITVGAASLLFAFQPRTGGIPTAASKPANNNNAVAPATIIVNNTTQVAVAIPAVAKSNAAPVTKQHTPAAINTTTADNTDNSTKDVVVPATNDGDVQLASAPAVTPATTMDLGSIPAFSLKRLSTPESLNDEITIIKSAPSKKKHRKHGEEEETTRVIILNKKFDSQPGIRYQLPVRF